jgi:hypothetical protein
VSATGSVSATTSVLTPILTTSSATALNVGTSTATSLTLGGTGTFVTSIPGVLSTSLGNLSGKISNFIQDTLGLTTGTVTLDTSTLNINSVMYFFGAAVPAFNYIVSAGVNGQQITFKHIGSSTVTLQFTGNIYLNTSITTVSTTTLASGSVLVVYYQNGWYQQNATASLSLTTSLSSPLVTSSAGLNIGTTGATSITLGASGITTTLNSDLTMGSNKTVFTTSAQQMRMGYPNTVATAPSAASSLGPFFKSFGPASVTGITYTIPFEGANGLFTATGLDGCGGLLTITIKSTSSKFATYVYSMAKRVGNDGFTSLNSISLNTGGWTSATPSVNDGPGNDILITFNAADWSGAFVSWMFLGSS